MKASICAALSARILSRDVGIDGSHVFAGPRPLWGRPGVDLQALVAPLLCSRVASTAVQARKKVEAKFANIIMMWRV
jgi:hypothetical protein